MEAEGGIRPKSNSCKNAGRDQHDATTGQEHHGVLVAGKRQGKGMEQVPPSEPQKEPPLLTRLISGFWPSKL